MHLQIAFSTWVILLIEFSKVSFFKKNTHSSHKNLNNKKKIK